jgi:Peptidase M15
MRNVTRVVFATVLALLIPAAANAKSYNGDGSKSRHRSVAHRNQEANDGGSATSRSCLTSDARALLNSIENQFGRVEIVSTCRAGARIATSGRPSKHASGEAIDFRAPGKKQKIVQWLINNHGDGGTMTYSDMDHIHVDVGYHFVALNRPSGH